MSITTRPRVSVIVPGKDAGEYIGDLMTSLTKQVDDPREMEIVVISDGSTDDTAAIARTFSDRLPNLEVVENKTPVGAASARNQGIAATSAPYVVFADADDWMAPRRLTHLVDAMDALKVDFIRTDHTAVRARRRDVTWAPQARRGVVLDPRDSILPVNYSTMVDYPYSWAGIFDRSISEDGLLTFPEGLHTAEDRPWIWDLFLRGRAYATIDAPTLCYRRTVTTSLTATFDRRQLDILPALRQTFDIVEADRDAELFLPKLTRTALALIAHHMSRRGNMTHDVRRDLKRGSRDLFASLRQDVLAQEASQMSRKRERLLHGLLPADLPRDKTLKAQQEVQA
ncbi:glycosyltransferase family 2 protein [Promicromonospora thailandica]|uniref:Glycosyltransferase involved in cell wall bisynthesis n=1 Tax=Promicromonospora thailandica TaxID=765201 RepID=A0A9X2G2Y2_9MICO|nr:glycosyltransferase family 2 protein [Promicromonospora thailandica]MCP2266107.1 Glycosyltransferase involved in cell wall bisynthesis [Promicromonospora thailandica]BFF20576.1 glycosyltransferase family 2 protein [Promicromonospora thailandica]